MNKITPFLWFNDNAGDAAEFCLSVFPEAKKVDELRSSGEGPFPLATPSAGIAEIIEAARFRNVFWPNRRSGRKRIEGHFLESSRSALRLWCATLISLGLLLTASASHAQQGTDQGHSIGRVSTNGNLIVMELNAGTLGKANLFDLSGRTLRFTPENSGYRVNVEPLSWEADYGPELNGAEVSLSKFAFPFSGKSWASFLVGNSGSIRFGVTGKNIPLDPYGQRDGGIILDRFDQLSEVAAKLTAQAPAICVFLKPRLFGPRYVKELSDHVVITWGLTEPFGGLLDFTWFKTINRFQAVLFRDGSIEMSYKELAAKDAVVGIYPASSGADKPAAVHFSSLSRKDGPFETVYESFHYLVPPPSEDLSCTVIQALGDKFDFLAYYSDFRVDSQEASPPGDGPVEDNVSGIGVGNSEYRNIPRALVRADHCTQGRFQQGLRQPVYVGANEAQEGPPKEAPVGSVHDITFYRQPLAEASPDRNPLPYSYAVGHLGHEVAHNWGAYVSAKVNGQSISLGPFSHWSPWLQTRVAFPYSLPIEASTLAGGVWQDNFDGTFTLLRDFFFVPATGYSYLDLYLMGFIPADEVPDFFILNNPVPVGKDANGRSVYRAQPTKITIQDVIAASGPRQPDVAHSQRKFNTGIVVMVEPGRIPSRELLQRADGIRRQWMIFWGTATGHRASMTTNPR